MKYLPLITLLFVLATSAFANDAILRVSCQPQDAGSNVYINGVLKGECPVDIMLNAGPVTLEVKKTVDAEYVQTFKQKFTVYAGVAKRVIVTLSEPQLTPAAKKARERAAMLQKKKEAEAQKKREIAAFRRDKKAAGAGDIDAMEALASYYETGTGTKKDPVKANAWRITLKAAKEKIKLAKEKAEADNELRAARAGNIPAMAAMVQRYTDGKGVDKNLSLASDWEQRIKQAKQAERQQKADQKKEAALANKRSEIKRKINKLEPFACYEYLTKNVDSQKFFEVMFTGLPGSVLGCASDTILFPFKLTYERILLRELNAHAAVWAKPDSMVAKAYRLQQSGNQEIAAR